MAKAYESYWKNYFNFSDRTSRSGYWYVVLMNIIISVGFVFYICLMAGIMEDSEYFYEIEILLDLSLLIFLGFYIANIIPSISIVVRRLHDINESGGLFFIQLIPYIGSLIILIMMCLNSVNENNKYGKQV